MGGPEDQVFEDKDREKALASGVLPIPIYLFMFQDESGAVVAHAPLIVYDPDKMQSLMQDGMPNFVDQGLRQILTAFAVARDLLVPGSSAQEAVKTGQWKSYTAMWFGELPKKPPPFDPAAN